MKKTLIYFPTILLVIFSIILINVASVEAINVFPKGPHFKLMEKLSKEQQEEVKNKVKELWDSGASREEIRDGVKEMFEKYGVDFPDDMKGFQGMRGARHGRGFMKFSDQLSEDQINNIKNTNSRFSDCLRSIEKLYPFSRKLVLALGEKAYDAIVATDASVLPLLFAIPKLSFLAIKPLTTPATMSCHEW